MALDQSHDSCRVHSKRCSGSRSRSAPTSSRLGWYSRSGIVTVSNTGSAPTLQKSSFGGPPAPNSRPSCHGDRTRESNPVSSGVVTIDAPYPRSDTPAPALVRSRHLHHQPDRLRCSTGEVALPLAMALKADANDGGNLFIVRVGLDEMEFWDHETGESAPVDVDWG
jgi:hypothetical protein